MRAPSAGTERIRAAVWLTLPPLAALLIAVACPTRQASGDDLGLTSTPGWLITLGILTTYGHINLGLVRCYGSRDLQRRFGRRLLWGPLLLAALLLGAPPLFYGLNLIAIHWDSYHSVKQTYGLGRLLDGAPASPAARRIDLAFCTAFHYLPYWLILAWLTPAAAAASLGQEWPPQWLPAVTPAFQQGLGLTVAAVMAIAGGLWALRLWHFPIAPARAALYGITAVTTLWVASRYSLAATVLFGNLYHGLQYIWLVGERGALRLDRRWLVLAAGLAGGLALLRAQPEQGHVWASLWLITSLVHFWSDGFVWRQRPGSPRP